jgi:hypothetical protein
MKKPFDKISDLKKQILMKNPNRIELNKKIYNLLFFNLEEQEEIKQIFQIRSPGRKKTVDTVEKIRERSIQRIGSFLFSIIDSFQYKNTLRYKYSKKKDRGSRPPHVKLENKTKINKMINLFLKKKFVHVSNNKICLDLKLKKELKTLYGT